MGQIKIPRITTAQRTSLTLDVGELVYDTTNGSIYKGDGATAGGVVVGGGGVTSVTGTTPIASSGGNTPAISIAQSSGAASGFLSSTDWTTFNNKGSGTVTSVATAGLISGGTITSTGTITTSVATNKLIGRGTTGTGVMEEITLGTNVSLTGTTLNATGSVTSVGLSAPSFLSVSGSPITASGTLALALSGTALPVLNGGTGTTTSTGSTNVVLSNAPTLVAPVLGLASATALSFSSTTSAGLKLNNLTTSQRQALTPTLGDKVYDTTIGAECVYNGTFWEYTLCKVLTSHFSTASTTMVTITGFTFPVEANSSYLVEGTWVVGTSNTSGYTIGNDILASANSYSFMFGPSTSGLLFQSLNNVNGVGNAVLMSRFVATNNVKFSGFLSTGATAGNINMQIKSGLATNTLTVNGGLAASGSSSYTTFKKVS